MCFHMKLHYRICFLRHLPEPAAGDICMSDRFTGKTCMGPTGRFFVVGHGMCLQHYRHFPTPGTILQFYLTRNIPQRSEDSGRIIWKNAVESLEREKPWNCHLYELRAERMKRESQRYSRLICTHVAGIWMLEI